MKIFISWSGERSRAVAQVLKPWIKAVLQATEPWLSTHDIQSGATWRETLRDNLADVENGVICLTNANQTAPWLLFEAGAIAKLDNSRTCTLLIDLKPTDVKDPLAIFQSSNLGKESLRKLFKDFNSRLKGKESLDDITFTESFDAHWERNCVKLETAINTPEKSGIIPARTEKDMLEELLKGVRDVSSNISGMKMDSAIQRAQESMRFSNFAKQALGSPWPAYYQPDISAGVSAISAKPLPPEEKI